MKKSLAIAWWCLLCLPVFGQATYYGNGVYSGSAAYGTGALLTYPARTDNCETGSEPSGPYGCNASATTGQQGATLSYLGRSGDTLPSLGVLSGAGDGFSHCVSDPDFGARICRITDYTHFTGSPSWNLGSAESRRFSSDSPPSFLIAQTSFAGLGIILLTYSGSGPTTAVISAPTALLGSTILPGAYAFSAMSPYVMWEFLNGQYSPSSAVAIPPTTCSSAGCVYINQLNKLTLGCSAGTLPLCATGNLIVASRVKVFDFNCEGAGCPSASTNYNNSGGFNIGTDSPNCLPANWATNWNGVFWVSDDDTTATIAMGDDGQGGLPGGTCNKGSQNPCLGAVKLANWTANKGCRAMDTYAGTVTGDYGATGTTINGQPNVITGIANQTLPDHFAMHEGGAISNPNFSVFSPTHSCAAPPTVSLLSFVTDSSGIPTFTTNTNSFFVGQTVSFTHAAESWLNNMDLLIPPGGIIDNQHFTTGTTGHNSYNSGAEPGNAVVTSATSNSCQCGINGIASYCNVYYWHTSDLTVEPCGVGNQTSQCQGHTARGYVDDYRAKYYTAYSFANPTLPTQDADGVACPASGCQLFANSFPVDQHGTYENHGTGDQTPVFMVTTNVCGQAPGNQGSGACDPEYTASGYDEVDAGEEYINNANAKHCGGGPCNYRFAHTGNTGTNWNFNTQNAVGVISNDGNWLALATDWGLGFGCTDGSTTCLTALQASAPADETITGVSVDGTGVYLTVTTSGTVKYVVGQRMTFSGTAEGWLNAISGPQPNYLVITSVSSPSFTGTGIPAGHGSFTNASDTGAASAATCVQDQTMPCQRGDLVIVALPTAHQ